MTRQVREEGFLSRWARRKAEEQSEVEAPEEVRPELPAEAEESREADSQEQSPPEELPDPESLGPEDDWSPFLKRSVPPQIRAQALRRLWRLDPVFANLDGLVDYAEDYNGTQFTGQPIKTLFKVGRGMLVDEEEPKEQPDDQPQLEGEAQGEAAAQEAEPTSAPEIAAAASSEAVQQVETQADGVAENQQEAEEPDTERVTAARRDKAPRRGGALARRWGLSQEQGTGKR